MASLTDGFEDAGGRGRANVRHPGRPVPRESSRDPGAGSYPMMSRHPDVDELLGGFLEEARSVLGERFVGM